MITAIILTRNEEKNLKDCLESLKWTDEIIIVDDCSNDKTIEIAKKYTNKIIVHKMINFSDQHNFAVTYATGDWLLYVDADERVGDDLKEEITKKIANDNYQGYEILRLNNFLGQFMYHGGWYPEYLIRLMKKKALEKWQGEIHETAKVTGIIGRIDKPILHFAHRSISEMLNKTIKWAKIEALLRFQANHPKMNLKRFLGAMWREFFYRAIKKSGWKDGIIGWIEIIYQTYSVFITYASLWEMQNKQKINHE